MDKAPDGGFNHLVLVRSGVRGRAFAADARPVRQSPRCSRLKGELNEFEIG